MLISFADARYDGRVFESLLGGRVEANAVSQEFSDCFLLGEWVNPVNRGNRHATYLSCRRLQLFMGRSTDRPLYAQYIPTRGRKKLSLELGPGARAIVLRSDLLASQLAGRRMMHIRDWDEALAMLERAGPWRRFAFVEFPDAPPIGAMHPRPDPQQHDGFARDPLVRAWAIRRAGWRCEVCSAVPFETPSGDPYLEVHHIRRLADGGPDIVENVAALCANCHREAHFGRRSDRIRARLVEIRREQRERGDVAPNGSSR